MIAPPDRGHAGRCGMTFDGGKRVRARIRGCATASLTGILCLVSWRFFTVFNSDSIVSVL